MDFEIKNTRPLNQKKYGEPTNSAYGSGGSMRDPMYKNIACEGTYHPQSGRGKRRHSQKSNGVCLSKKKKFYEV